MDTPRIVVDSNVFVSAALAIHSKKLESPSAAVFFKVVRKDVVAVASSQMLYELAGKLSLPSFGLSAAFVIDYVELLADAVEMVSIRGLDMGCRDEKDNMFIETAYNGRVDVLVTRDLDLQDAQTRYDLAKRKCKVLNVSEFLAVLPEIAHHEERFTREAGAPDQSNGLLDTNDIEPTSVELTSTSTAGAASASAAIRTSTMTSIGASATILATSKGFEYRWLTMHAGKPGNGVNPPQIGSLFEQDVFRSLTREGWRVTQTLMHPGYCDMLLLLLEKELL